MKVSYDVSKFKVGDRVKVSTLENPIIGRISHIYSYGDDWLDGKCEVTADGTKIRRVVPTMLLEPELPKRPFNCCNCIHFELCRSMFGGAGKLPCDFDDYFEALDGAKPDTTLGEAIEMLSEVDTKASGHIGDWLRKADTTFVGDFGEAVVAGAMQNWCKRLKWHHDVTYNEETEKYVALVVPPGNETWLDDVEADTAAKAILIAYINAKESLK